MNHNMLHIFDFRHYKVGRLVIRTDNLVKIYIFIRYSLKKSNTIERFICMMVQ
jgi:hypothetical protein